MSIEDEPAFERAAQAADSLRRTVAAAAELRVTVHDPDELVQVTADGTPALSRVELDARVFRRPVDQVCALLTTVVDEALTTARRARLEAFMAALPAGLRTLAESGSLSPTSLLPGDGATRPAPDVLARATDAVRSRLGELESGVHDLIEEEFEGTAGDGQVVVTVTGQGRVRRITLGRDLFQNVDSAATAEHLVTATNGALGTLAARIAELAGAGPTTDLVDSLQAFNRRMDDLLVRLDTLGRALEIQ